MSELKCSTSIYLSPIAVTDVNDSITHQMLFDQLLPFQAVSQAEHYVDAESAARTLSRQP